MSAPLVIATPEEDARHLRRLLPAIVGITLVLIMFLAGGLPLWVTIVGATTSALVAGAIFAGAQYLQHASTRAMTQAIAPLGYVPRFGPLLAELPRWPIESFPALTEASWNILHAFDHRAGDFRIFQASDSDGDSTSYLFGAAIHVPAGRLPVFRIRPVRNGLLSRGKASAPIFRSDAAFAEQHEIVTGDAALLERRLGAAFAPAWRAMAGWQIEGNGDWVLVRCNRSIGRAEMPDVTQSLLALAGVLRDAARAR